MTTISHTPVRSARRCIGSAVSKIALVAAGAVSSLLAFTLVGAISADPEAAFATSPNAASTQVAAGYGWPIKPFDRQHPVRGNFGDPRSTFLADPTLRGLMRGACACSYHAGIDIAAPDGTAVYPVKSGVVRIVTPTWVEVDSGAGVAFQYWHIIPVVRVGDAVQAGRTILGRTVKAYKHVHLTQLQDGKAVNPLAPGNIGPYTDRTAPKVGPITFRSGDLGPELLPEYVHGRVEIVAEASDTPAKPVPGQWHGLPVTPAKLTYRVVHLPDRATVIAETTALDVTRTLPDLRDMWRTYARGTRQNFVPMGVHRYWYQPGVYLFKIAPSFDTTRLKDGAYELTVTASDTRANRGSGSQIFTVHNSSSWLKG